MHLQRDKVASIARMGITKGQKYSMLFTCYGLGLARLFSFC